MLSSQVLAMWQLFILVLGLLELLSSGCHVLQPSRGAACEYLIRETNGKTMFVNKIDIKSEKVVLLELFLLNSYEVFCQTK